MVNNEKQQRSTTTSVWRWTTFVVAMLLGTLLLIADGVKARETFGKQSAWISKTRIPSTDTTLRGGAVAFGGGKRKNNNKAPAKPVVVAPKPKPKRDTKKKATGDTTNNVGGQATMSASIFNLVNNVAGAGILALSAGQAAGTGWIPSILICIALGLISSHTFSIVGEACDLASCQDFKGLWAFTLGENTTYVVDAMIAMLCIACAVIYSGILGDVFTPLLAQAGFPAKYNDRSTNILAITIAALLPMSLIKNLSALAFTSILGFSAIMYTVLFITWRALDGSYKLGSGKFVTDDVLNILPSFERSSLFGVGFQSLVLASNLGLAYVAHYNSPSFYRELKDTNAKRFRTMVNASFTLLILLYIVTMTAGYSTFGDACQGNILLNYHPDDILALMGRLATGFSILFGFPLVAAGARESIQGVASSLGYKQIATSHFPLVIGLLSLITLIACTVKDVSLVVGLTGAAMGSFIVYICPGILYAKTVKNVKGVNSPEYRKAKSNILLVPFGLFIGGLGVYMTIKESASK